MCYTVVSSEEMGYTVVWNEKLGYTVVSNKKMGYINEGMVSDYRGFQAANQNVTSNFLREAHKVKAEQQSKRLVDSEQNLQK